MSTKNQATLLVNGVPVDAFTYVQVTYDAQPAKTKRSMMGKVRGTYTAKLMWNYEQYKPSLAEYIAIREFALDIRAAAGDWRTLESCILDACFYLILVGKAPDWVMPRDKSPLPLP